MVDYVIREPRAHAQLIAGMLWSIHMPIVEHLCNG